MHQRITLSDVPEVVGHQAAPVASHPQWARRTGILGGIACWAGAKELSQSQAHCPGAPGPVYGRVVKSPDDTLSFSQLRRHWAGGHLFHVSPESGDPAGLLLPNDHLDAALTAGCVLVHQRAEKISVWIPSIDAALHRPAVILTEVPRAESDATALFSSPRAGFADQLTSGLLTMRSAYRCALLQTLSAVEELRLQMYDSPTLRDVPIPQLPTCISAKRATEIKGVLNTLALLHRIRYFNDSTSAGQAKKHQLAALAGVTSDLQRGARLYLDALWTEAINESSVRPRG